MNKTRSSLAILIITLALLLPFPRAVIQADPGDFAGGDGSAGDPYQISDWNHLDCARYDPGACFVLINDLDADTEGYAGLAGPAGNGGLGWEPIGTEVIPFIGAFDGQGYDISGLTIDRPEMDYVGLFGYAGPGSLIESVSLSDANVAGYFMVGCLVGLGMGAVSDSHVSGSVEGYAAVAGLVGYNEEDGSIVGCSASVSVSGDWVVGGLAGQNAGRVERCRATGAVVCSDQEAGGLVGGNEAIVTDCYATGSVTGESSVGGLIGSCYITSAVSNCYSACRVSASSYVGGLVGKTVTEVTDSYWDMQASGQATSEGGVGVVGKTTAEMMQLATFSEWDMTGVDFGELDPTAVWNVIDGHSYPFLGCCRMKFELKTGWNMVSVPRELPPGKDTVAEVFKGEIVAIYWWNPASKSYVVPTIVEPDCGYWVAVTEDKVITYMV